MGGTYDGAASDAGAAAPKRSSPRPSSPPPSAATDLSPTPSAPTPATPAAPGARAPSRRPAAPSNAWPGAGSRSNRAQPTVSNAAVPPDPTPAPAEPPPQRRIQDQMDRIRAREKADKQKAEAAAQAKQTPPGPQTRRPQKPPRPPRPPRLSDEDEADLARTAAAMNRTRDIQAFEPIAHGALEAEPAKALRELHRLGEQLTDPRVRDQLERMIDGALRPKAGARPAAPTPDAVAPDAEPVFTSASGDEAETGGEDGAPAPPASEGRDLEDHPVPISGDGEAQTQAAEDEQDPDPGLVTRFEALDRNLDEVGRGVLGPAWEQAKGLARLATELSPWSDGEAVAQAMDGIIDGLRADDAAAVQKGVEGLSWAIVGAAAPGRVRATRDMPYDQRAKLDGPPPEPPTSPEQNIARGTKAMARVLATGQADMAAMHRKDLGWIAFEPGVVSLTAKGQVKGAGLRKIQRKHAADIAELPNAIALGKLQFITTGKGRRSAELRRDGMVVSIRLDRYNNRETWVITGYRKED